MNIYNNFIHRHRKSLGSRLDNTDIRLMWDKIVQILPPHSRAFERSLYRPPHYLCCKAEHRLAVHVDEVESLCNRLGGHGTKAAARGNVERITA